jgi:hypothetical protein
MRRNVIRGFLAIMAVFCCAAWGIAAESAEPRATIDISGHPFKGAVNAPVTVVVFSDYL